MRGLRSVWVLIFCIGCLDPYRPDVANDDLKLLVVDGYINSDGNATVKLSRSIPLYAFGIAPFEKGATVTIESSAGDVFSLSEEDEGTYTSSNLHVNFDDEYTLKIITSVGQEYHSEKVKMYATPEVDRIYYDVAPTGDHLRILVDSRDDNPGATGFYLWDCIETYEYHAPIHSAYKFVNKTAIQRLPEEEVYVCYKDEVVPSVVGDVNRLSENIIRAQEVVTIPKYSRKISARYSVLVRQRAISEDEYKFRQQILQTTQLQGSLFATVPGPVTGNVHSITNGDEFVLGYFRAQEVKEKRFFITRGELPGAFWPQKVSDCQAETSCFRGRPQVGPKLCIDIDDLSDSAVIIDVVNVNSTEYAYVFAAPECGDCRALGGTTTRPSFW